MLLQTLKTMVSNLCPQRKTSASSNPCRIAPSVETLEAREVMSASVGFQHGILTVHLTNNGQYGESAVVKNNGGYVYVGRGAGSPAFNPYLRVPAYQVREIRVYGSDRADSINLSEVSTKFFPNIRQTWVEGRGGHDHIIGSQVADFLFGQGGRDTIHGQAGDDVIYGGTGNDLLEGGKNRDRIHGEQGNDRLFGNSRSSLDNARDYLFGGQGRDRTNRSVLGANDIIRSIERRN